MVMGNNKNSRVFNFTILLKLRKSRTFDARKIYMFYSSLYPTCLSFVSNSNVHRSLQVVNIIDELKCYWAFPTGSLIDPARLKTHQHKV